MPQPKILLIYVLAFIAVALIVSRIPGVTLSMLAHDHRAEEPLAIGTNTWPGFEPLYLARERGVLSPDTARLLEYSSSTQVKRSFANQTIDVAALTLDEALLLADVGVPMVIVLVMDFSDGGDAILAEPGITDMASLRGKRIGVESTALGAFLLSRALDLNGLERADVVVVSAEFDEHEALVMSGDVDAVVTFGPLIDQLRERGWNEIFSSREVPGEIVDVLVANPHVLEGHAEQLRDVLSVWFDSLLFMQQQSRQAAELMAPRLGITPAEVASQFELLHLPDVQENRRFLAGPEPAILETVSKLGSSLSAAGLIDKPVNAERLLSAELLPSLDEDGEDR